MPTHRGPVVGIHYENLTGKLMKVRALGYEASRIDRVAIEYIDGRRQVVGIEDWYALDLVETASALNERIE